MLMKYCGVVTDKSYVGDPISRFAGCDDVRYMLDNLNLIEDSQHRRIYSDEVEMYSHTKYMRNKMEKSIYNPIHYFHTYSRTGDGEV